MGVLKSSSNQKSVDIETSKSPEVLAALKVLEDYTRDPESWQYHPSTYDRDDQWEKNGVSFRRVKGRGGYYIISGLYYIKEFNDGMCEYKIRKQEQDVEAKKQAVLRKIECL